MQGFEIVSSLTLPKDLPPEAACFGDTIDGKEAIYVKACVTFFGGTTEESGYLLQEEDVVKGANKTTLKYFLLVPCPSGDMTLRIWSQDDGEREEACIILPVARWC